eukprot:347095_1
MEPLTLQPTSNMHVCGINNKLCLTVYIYPAQSLSKSVSVIINDDAAATHLDITFVPLYADCTYPAITFKYEQIDISLSSEFIEIYDNNGNIIEECQGNAGADSQCSTWWTCVNQRSLGIDVIPKDSSYKISLIEGSEVDALCGGDITTNATLTLICNSYSLAPTIPSTSPTLQPTTPPTTESKHPTISPTFLQSCGNNKLCLTEYFYPAKSLSTPVSIIINDDGTTTYVDIT